MTEATADKLKGDWRKEDPVISTRLSDINTCRICQIDATLDEELISPCLCSGSVELVHKECLNRWINISKKKECEICGYSFILKKKTPWEWLPLQQWEKKNLSRSLASVLFALFLLIGSLCHRAEFQRRFWTNVMLETIGCIGVAALLLFHGRFYVKLTLRLIDHNRRFVIDTSSLPLNQKQMNPDECSTPAGSENVDLPAVGRVESIVGILVFSKHDSSDDTSLEIETDV